MDGNLVFAMYADRLSRMRLSHVWRGHGSCLFLEFGALERRLRRDNSLGNPEGEITAMIPWSWRIERGPKIVCGSESEEPLWYQTFEQLIGTTVHDVSTFGRLPELQVSLSDQFHVVSFMTAEGDPCWSLMDKRAEPEFPTILVEGRRIVVEAILTGSEFQSSKE